MNIDDEGVQCGYIKAKFGLHDGKEIWEHPAYVWALQFKNPRVTSSCIYVTLGHESIPSNERAMEILCEISMMKGKVTRLDFFVDYLGKLDFEAFYNLHDNSKKPMPSIVMSPSGVTVYVGKRSSDRMLRVYDKKAEVLAKRRVNIGFDVTRLELEVKGKMIARYRTMFLAGKQNEILYDIQELYGLRGFCERHEKSRPVDASSKDVSAMGFVYRFRQVIRRAVMADPGEFLRTIGVKSDVFVQSDGGSYTSA